jgi:hypothetical protein
MTTVRINQVYNFRYQNVFLPEMPDNCLLFLDSYGGQNDDDMFNEVDEEVNSGKLLERLTIPPKTTPFIQPWWFQPWWIIVF